MPKRAGLDGHASLILDFTGHLFEGNHNQQHDTPETSLNSHLPLPHSHPTLVGDGPNPLSLQDGQCVPMNHLHSIGTSPSPTLEAKFKKHSEDHFQPAERHLLSPLPGDFLSSLADFDGQQSSHMPGPSIHPGEVNVVDEGENKDPFASLAAHGCFNLKADGARNDGNLSTTPRSR